MTQFGGKKNFNRPCGPTKCEIERRLLLFLPFFEQTEYSAYKVLDITGTLFKSSTDFVKNEREIILNEKF